MRLGESWSYRFDLKSTHVTGLGENGLRFEKGGDMLKDADGKGIEGRFLVDRTADGQWELTDTAALGSTPSTSDLRESYGVWKAGPLKRLFARTINPKDVTPLREIFDTPNVVQVLSSAGGLVVHSALSVVESAFATPSPSQYGDASLVASGHISSIQSHSNYEYDDMGEVAVDAIIKRDQESFRAR